MRRACIRRALHFKAIFGSSNECGMWDVLWQRTDTVVGSLITLRLIQSPNDLLREEEREISPC